MRTVAASPPPPSLTTGRTPHPGWAEGEPDAWWANVVEATRRIGGAVRLDGIGMVGVSGMVPALICLDADGRVLRPSIQQNDARARPRRSPRFGATAGRRLPRRHRPAHLASSSILPRLLWLRRHEPDVYRRIRRVLGSYDLVTHRLTGEWSLERNWALESGFWDARRGAWYAPALRRPRRRPRRGSRRCARRTTVVGARDGGGGRRHRASRRARR